MAEIGRAGKRVGRHYTLFRGLRLQATLQTKQLQQFRPKMFEQDGPYCESRVSTLIHIIAGYIIHFGYGILLIDAGRREAEAILSLIPQVGNSAALGR